MAKTDAGSNEDHQGWRSWIRHAGAFLSLPSNLFLNRERAGSATRSGVGTSAAFGLQRRSLMFGIVLLAIMAALVGSLIAAPWGLSNPQAASAQQVCAVPILGLQTSPGILYISAVYPGIIFVNQDEVLANPNEVDAIYETPQSASRPEYQIVASGEAFDDAAPWTSFEFFEFSGENIGSIVLSGTVELELAPLSRWKVRVRILCNSGDHSATVEDTVQVEKFRPFTLSLTLNGTAVYSLEEGQTGTLTMTLVNAGDVFDRDVDYQLDLKTNPLIYPEEDNPITAGEVTVTGGKADNVSTLLSGQSSVTWTLTAVQDNLVNDPDDADDGNGESAVEWAYVFIWTVDVGNGGLVKAPASWGGNLHILDVDPDGVVPTATLAGNTPAQGSLLIGAFFDGVVITPEIHDVICGNVLPIFDAVTHTVLATEENGYEIPHPAGHRLEGQGSGVYYAVGATFDTEIARPIDVDGEPIGGFGYRYEWRRSGTAIPGETGACYKVTLADIGHSFSAQVWFEDRLLNTETFSSVGSTGVVASGPTIVATNGYFFEEPLTVDLTTMTYSYCNTGCGINELQLLPSNVHYPVGTKVGYQWIHVDAYGNRVYDREERVVNDTNADGVIDETDTPQNVIVGGAYSPGWATNTYSPTERWDAGQYLQVMVTFMGTVNGNAFTATKLANVQTPLITQTRFPTNTNNLERISDDEETIQDAISDAEESISDAGSQASLEPVTVPDQFNETLLETIPTNLSAWLPNLGGGVGLRWSATVGRQAGSGFEYRYKPTVFADTGFTAWQAAPGGTEARAVTIPNLINNVEYMFEVRSIGSSGGATEIHTIVYQHRVKDCTV
jgi:hypothetical protein